MEKKDRQMMIDHHINGLVKVIRRDFKEEIMNDIHQRINQMEKLLENGEPIWEEAFGVSFDRIHAARQRIYAKIFFLREMWTILYLRY